jgi:hypothetical protein
MTRAGRTLAFACALAALAFTLAAVAGGARNGAELVSTSSFNGNGAFATTYAGSSDDGTRVFFRTQEKLAATDTDPFFDVYERSGSTTSQISTGPAGGNGVFVPTYQGASADGTHVFFETGEPLVASDTDDGCDDMDGKVGNCDDVYERSGDTTTLVSTGPAGGNGTSNARFRGVSASGTRVFFTTREQLTSSDTDNSIDIYERAGGTTTLVSTGPSGGNGAFEPIYRAISRDGTHVVFETGESLVGADTDSATDVYDRSDGTTTLVSTGPSGGNGASDASYRGSTPDGSHAFFETPERLTSGDTDSSVDVYDRSGGTTTLVSKGPAGGNGAPDALYQGSSQGGTHVFFQTIERLVAGDTDSASDIYDGSGGTATLVSTGPIGGNGGADALFQGNSADGSHVFVGTTESLATGDADGRFDIYDRVGVTTTLVTTGPIGGSGAFDAFFRDASRDGSRVFFESPEALTSDDTNGLSDLYERAGGATTRVSIGGTGISQATFIAADQDASRVFFGTGEKISSADTDSVSDIYVARLADGFARPKGATPTSVSFVIAYRPCTSPNREHGAPLDVPSCAPPVQASDELTVGTLDANQKASQSIGSMRLDAVPGNLSTPADEADVKVSLSMTDVRMKSDLSDYGGELGATTTLRMTDKRNGSVPVDSATAEDLPFSFVVPCTPTPATGIGSTCATDTTADALVPGMVSEGARTIWQLGQFQLFDGGPDGLASTSPNTLFAAEGYFVP